MTTSLSRTEIAKVLKEATCSYFLKKGYSNHLELGLCPRGRLRGDVVSINLKGFIIVSEVKSSKSDFLTDKKWHQYLVHCNQLYFIFLPEVYEQIKEELGPKIKEHGTGVLVLDKHTGYLRCAVSAKKRLIKKGLKRMLTIRMAWRNGISKRNSRRKRQFINES